METITTKRISTGIDKNLGKRTN